MHDKRERRDYKKQFRARQQKKVKTLGLRWRVRWKWFAIVTIFNLKRKGELGNLKIPQSDLNLHTKKKFNLINVSHFSLSAPPGPPAWNGGWMDD